jgi:hypothetical protein
MEGARGEAELNRLIERRSDNGEVDPDEREELWKASVAAYNARKREENRLAWREYHREQAERHRATLEALVEHHVTRAELYRLEEEEG